MSVPRNIHLVMPATEFEAVLRKQLFSGDVWAIGGTHWRTTPHEQQVIVHSLTTSESLPRGKDRSPLDDLFVMQVTGGGELNPGQIIAAMQPLRSQTIVVLQLHGEDHSRWAGAVFRDGNVVPLAGFRIVGGEMLTVAANDDETTNELTIDVDARSSRLRGAVGDQVYGRVRGAAVTVIGASRSGTLAAWNFAALGVSRLRLCDFDVVAEHNLDNMIGIEPKAVGTKKVLAVAEALLRYRPDMSVTCFEHSVLDPKSDTIFEQPTDLFVTCTDNISSRVAVSLQAQRLLVPHLDLGTSVQRDEANDLQISADARLFLPGHGCCSCAPPLTPSERESVLYELSAPGDTLARGLPTRWSAQRAGSLITINSLSVAAGVQMWLDLLGGHFCTSFWQRIAWHSGRGLETHSASIGAADDCPYCNR